MTNAGEGGITDSLPSFIPDDITYTCTIAAVLEPAIKVMQYRMLAIMHTQCKIVQSVCVVDLDLLMFHDLLSKLEGEFVKVLLGL